jgi:hypothetical protein
MVIICFIVIIWSILTIELTLVWTNVTGVNGLLTVGQLIPATIGLSGLLRTIHLITIKRADEVRFIAHMGTLFC